MDNQSNTKNPKSWHVSIIMIQWAALDDDRRRRRHRLVAVLPFARHKNFSALSSRERSLRRTDRHHRTVAALLCCPSHAYRIFAFVLALSCRFPHRRSPIRSTSVSHRPEDFSLGCSGPNLIRARCSLLRNSSSIAKMTKSVEVGRGSLTAKKKKTFFRRSRLLRCRSSSSKPVHMRSCSWGKNPHEPSRLTRFFFLPTPGLHIIANSRPRIVSFLDHLQESYCIHTTKILFVFF